VGSVVERMKKRIASEEEITLEFMKREETKRQSQADALLTSELEARKNAFKQDDVCKLEEFKTLGILGRGGFGVVSLVQDPQTMKTYALKAMKKSQIVELGYQDHIKREKDVMKSMNCDFLVNLRGTYKDKLRVYLLVDVCLGGELFTILRKHRYFEEEIGRFYSACVIEAFDYMHGQNIIYRDLKPENLVLDAKGYLKVTDFGFAKKIQDKTYTLCGTPDYFAPEIIKGEGHGKGLDWWTLGILIYEMLASFPPFYADNPIDTYRKIVRCKVRFPRYFTKTAAQLILSFLQVRPTKRLGVIHSGSVQKIREHDWFKTFKWENLKTFKTRPPIIPNLKDNKDMGNFRHHKAEKDDAKPIRPSQEFDDDF